MLIINLVLFLVSLVVLVKSADYAVRYCSKLARLLHLSEFIASFFIVSVISCLPEATVAVTSAVDGIPEFGLATLIGSNVADLLLVFGLVAVLSMKGITVKSEILRNDLLYLVLLLVPIILGFDGHLSREDGIVLILSGIVFFMTLTIQSKLFKKKFNHANKKDWIKNLFLLVLSLVFLIIGAHYTVRFGVDFANDISIPPFLIALTIVSIGTCMPELVFSLNAVRTKHDELALGDIFGTVIIDATILVGILAVIQPFDFNLSIIHVTGIMMFLGGVLVVMFIRSGNVSTKKEGILLLLAYILSLIIELAVNHAL